MTLITLAGFFLITLTCHGIEGKDLLLGSDKNTNLKPPEKRASNFRINVETPFDPNFWPSRGRRGRRDFEKTDNCVAANDYFEFQEHPEVRAKQSDTDIRSDDFDSGILTDEASTEGSCHENLMEPKAEGTERSSVSDASERKLAHRLNQFMPSKRRRQRVLPLSRLMALGNRLYRDESNNPFGEKMKKQDVFWVVRGKKNFQ